MSVTHVPVLIVGAGAGGLATSALLAMLVLSPGVAGAEVDVSAHFLRILGAGVDLGAKRLSWWWNASAATGENTGALARRCSTRSAPAKRRR
ncbi:hypothetical protein [Candidatus Mycobacterium methanotrophicum]|uniref:hypothetical protein n=1 Tax=Candidatus Mycobacterium methanotrophicum TaxID=2943498 RepID=UPI001C57C99B|nr:hypothetical protein [Candidatus Mycobacterium methanotrophicum]